MDYLGNDIFSEFCSYYRWKAEIFTLKWYKYVCSEGNAIKFIHKFNIFLHRYIVAMLNAKRNGINTSNLLYRWWFISDRGAGFSEENSLTHLHYRDHSTIPAHFRYHQWEDQANGSTTRDSFTSSFATGFWFTVSNSSLAVVHYQCYYNVVRISSEQFCFELHEE